MHPSCIAIFHCHNFFCSIKGLVRLLIDLRERHPSFGILTDASLDLLVSLPDAVVPAVTCCLLVPGAFLRDSRCRGQPFVNRSGLQVIHGDTNFARCITLVWGRSEVCCRSSYCALYAQFRSLYLLGKCVEKTICCSQAGLLKHAR